SAHPVLSPAIAESVEDVPVLGTLRRDEDDVEQWLIARAQAFVVGLPVVWPTGPVGDVSTLPTYPFQRQRYWLESVDGGVVDARSLGLSASSHPLLPAWVAVPDGVVFTGRLSLKAQPWLAEHVVFGTVLVPGTALVDMALHAGREAGLGELRELVLHAPLILGEQDERQLQVSVLGDEVLVRSRTAEETEWTTHARGQLQATTGEPAAEALRWPPDAPAADPEALYAELADAGYGYGPLFRGVRRLTGRPDELFAEVELAETVATEGFALHPALFDAALHPIVRLAAGGDATVVRLPFSWRTVRFASGHTAVRRLRVRLTVVGDDTVRVEAADEHGRPVLSVEGLTLRAADRAQLRARD
ncbi:polyketide synthase dehydratase domain-containing protein, partial [Streptomyces albogriseolus]|uniref:polyketide synthase dehydratase domain-containing protein n=1 Tax=Streptomyces albogriseolus TaxID=1887 RepID=UPI00345F2FB2